MSYLDALFTPPWMRAIYAMNGMPQPMIFPRMGGPMPNYGGDDDETRTFDASGIGPSRREIQRMQRAGIMGEMLPIGPNGAFGTVAMPPYMTGFRPRGGWDWEPKNIRNRAEAAASWSGPFAEELPGPDDGLPDIMFRQR